MHNLISSNQLAGWNNIDIPDQSSKKEQSELVNDYFDCLIDCDEDQSSCKRICKEILN
jgi:hypothetical protein